MTEQEEINREIDRRRRSNNACLAFAATWAAICVSLQWLVLR